MKKREKGVFSGKEGSMVNTGDDGKKTGPPKAPKGAREDAMPTALPDEEISFVQRLVDPRKREGVAKGSGLKASGLGSRTFVA